MKRVLVTGATGFIGRHLVARCAQDGYVVRGLVRNASARDAVSSLHEVAEGDVRDARAMKAAARDAEVVFHLAGHAHDISSFEERVYREVNVDGTRNVLSGAVDAGVRVFVFFSSVKAMGERTRGCVDETATETPETAYGRTKLEAERLVFGSDWDTGMRVVCLRPPLVYGPGNKGNLLRMIAAIDAGLFLPLPDTGSLRSVVHVSNLVEAALMAANNPCAHGRCYIVADAAYSTRALYEMIVRALGKRPPRWSVPLSVLRLLARAGDALGWIRRRPFVFDSDALAKLVEPACYSAARITQELGWRPRVSLEGALPELIDWYRAARG